MSDTEGNRPPTTIRVRFLTAHFIRGDTRAICQTISRVLATAADAISTAVLRNTSGAANDFAYSRAARQEEQCAKEAEHRGGSEDVEVGTPRAMNERVCERDM